MNQSSSTRAGPASLANDGKLGNENPDEQKCSETQKEPSPWWRVDLLTPQTVRVVRITTRGCCGNPPLQDLEIRVGNSSYDLQRNPLCAWYPGTVGTTTNSIKMILFLFYYAHIQLNLHCCGYTALTKVQFKRSIVSIVTHFQMKVLQRRLHVRGL